MSNNPAFDGLRALAVLLVFLFHAKAPGFKGAFIGVDVFFVLSGYLITSLLREEVVQTGGISLLSFYRNRALRLWPALILMLCTYLVAAPFLWPQVDAAGGALLAGFYLTDFSYPWYGEPDIVSHTWSLAVEAHFYLLWPFAVMLLARLERRQAMAILAVMFLFATAWRWHAAMTGANWHDLYFRFDMRVSGLALGALLAFAKWQPAPRSTEIMGGISLAAIVFLAMDPTWGTHSSIMYQPVTDLASAGLVAALASQQPTLLTKIFSARPAVQLGLISYAVYLWHYPIIRALRPDHDWIVVAVAGGLLSLILAQLSYTFLESPLRRLRHRGRGKASPAIALP